MTTPLTPVPPVPPGNFDNVLYLAVMPVIHMGKTNFGLTEELLTLFPNQEFATEFFDDEVNGYVATFENRAQKYLTGTHVVGFPFVLSRR